MADLVPQWYGSTGGAGSTMREMVEYVGPGVSYSGPSTGMSRFSTACILVQSN